MKAYFRSQHFDTVVENPTTEKPPKRYETESQLFLYKCEVKLHKHLNHNAERSRTLTKKRARPAKP